MRASTIPWQIHTPNLLRETLATNENAVLQIPMQIFADTLHAVAERAAELNDDKLNALMIKLTLYSIADGESPDFDPKVVEKYRKKWSE